MICPRCHAPTSAVYYVPRAVEPAQFEDQARMLYPDCSQRARPAWIIGAEDATLPGARPDRGHPARAVQRSHRGNQRETLQAATPQGYEAVIRWLC